MKRYFLLTWLVLSNFLFLYSQKYENKSYSSQIKTLQLYLNNNQLDLPVIKMGTSDIVTVSFDLMSHEFLHLAYKIQHCNADWTPSNLTEMEYMEGINEVVIEDPSISANTTFDYSHYSFSIPNDDIKFLLSGNYVVKIYDTDQPNKVMAIGCFSLEDTKVGIQGSVNGKTVYGVNREYQRLLFDVNFSDEFSALSDEIKVVVRQNGRRDNEVFGIKPTYIKPNSLAFEDERKLSFEGGTEYNIIDFSHRFRFSGSIDKITFYQPYYHVDVLPGKKEKGTGYEYDKDVNGRYKVHAQDIWSESEIDYSVVHFTYPAEEPWLDGAVYVGGYFNDNRLDDKNKMTYNFERKQYELALTLKNGGYNFQYLFLPSGLHAASNIRTEGSHWETENDYQIYVYYRPYGGQYDQLIGYSVVNSDQEQ